MAEVPLIGPAIQKIVVGGVEYGHHTLTCFFCPPCRYSSSLLIGLVVVHIYLFRKHGIHVKEPRLKKDSYLARSDLKRCNCLSCSIKGFRRCTDHLFPGCPPWSACGSCKMNSVARPEWYFLFLFQLLKYVPAFWGESVIIPAFFVLDLFLQPSLGQVVQANKSTLGFGDLIGRFCCLLTLLAFSEDRSTSPRCCDRGSQLAGRSCACNSGRSRPPAGVVTLLREDRENRGRVLFAAHCVSCHRYNGHDGRGYPDGRETAVPELAGFASVEWVTRLCHTHEHYVSEEYFGGTAFKDGTT